MYTVLFPSGKTEVFRVKALADTYVIAFKGIIISTPVDFNVAETAQTIMELKNERIN